MQGESHIESIEEKLDRTFSSKIVIGVLEKSMILQAVNGI